MAPCCPLFSATPFFSTIFFTPNGFSSLTPPPIASSLPLPFFLAFFNFANHSDRRSRRRKCLSVVFHLLPRPLFNGIPPYLWPPLSFFRSRSSVCRDSPIMLTGLLKTLLRFFFCLQIGYGAAQAYLSLLCSPIPPHLPGLCGRHQFWSFRRRAVQRSLWYVRRSSPGFIQNCHTGSAPPSPGARLSGPPPLSSFF